MLGYTVTKIEGNTIFMEKKDGHGGVSKTNCDIDEFKNKFHKEAKIGIVA